MGANQDVAVLYIHAWGKRQMKRAHQEAACWTHARERGFSVPEKLVIVDDTRNRAGLKQLLERTQANEFSRVVVHEFRSLGDRLEDVLEIRQHFLCIGVIVEVVVATEINWPVLEKFCGREIKPVLKTNEDCWDA